MNKPSAKVICHSQAPNGEELITFEIELHRFILPEFNTHRSLSRNFQSSRAVPVKNMIEQVRNDPAMPVHWGKNQRGMVAEFQFNETERQALEVAWKGMVKINADFASDLDECGLHKQIVNRLLEPFMWTKGVVTGTRKAFDAFFALRLHKDAQPEIKALAERMEEALKASTPKKLNYGDFHLPYVQFGGTLVMSCYANLTDLMRDAIKVSASCCGQVSYRKLDTSVNKAIGIFDMLNLPERGVYKDDPPHFSPTEHIAKVVNSTTSDKDSGNFHSGTFWQYRKALEVGNEEAFYAN